MTAHTPLSRPLIAALAALALTPVALAAGEAKNQAPFTRPAGQRLLAHVIQQADPAIRGESKNQYPFTRIILGLAARRGDDSDVFTRAVNRHNAT